MAELLSMDKDMAASFLNSVLNQLNWAFSEFIGMIQEVRRHFERSTGHATPKIQPDMFCVEMSASSIVAQGLRPPQSLSVLL